MAKGRNRSYHGSKRAEKVVIATPSTGTQAISVSLKHGELFQITTTTGASTALTIDVGDLYDGAEPRFYVNSLHASDTLVFTFNGTAEKNFTDGSSSRKVALTAADQNLVKCYVIDSTDGSEIAGISWEIF